VIAIRLDTQSGDDPIGQCRMTSPDSVSVPFILPPPQQHPLLHLMMWSVLSSTLPPQ